MDTRTVLRGAAMAAALTLFAGTAAAGPDAPIVLAQAPGDPLIQQAVRDLDRYEALANQMAPGDKTAGRQYLDALAGIGRRLNAVVNKNQPGWREAAERFNALQKRVADIANQPAAAGANPPAAAQAPAPAAPPRLISSDQARLNRVSNAIQSLSQQVAAAQFQAFLDAREVGNFRTAAGNRRSELEGFPREVPEVAAALKALDELDGQIEARVADALAKAGAVGNVDGQLAEMDERTQKVPVPGVQQLPANAGAKELGDYLQALVNLRRQSLADAEVLDRFTAVGFRDQRIERLRHWAVVERQRQIEENFGSLQRTMDGRVGRVLDLVRFQASTDPSNSDHVANRLLGEGRYETTAAEFTSGLADVGLALVVDTLSGRKDPPDRPAQSQAVIQARAAYEAKFAAALAASRMPSPGLSDERYAAVARETLANPAYDVKAPRRLVVNSKSVERRSKREGEINPGVVTTTVTIYDWEWDEYQVATAERVGDRFAIFYNTLKYFHRGGPTTPLNRWVLADRFQGPLILEENIDK